MYIYNIYTYTRVNVCTYIHVCGCYMYYYVAGCIPTTQEEEKLLLGHGNTSGLETGTCTYVSSFVYVSVSSADNAAAVHHVCQRIRSFIYLAHVAYNISFAEVHVYT